MNDKQKNAPKAELDKLIASLSKEFGWTDQETRNFLSSLTADSPEELFDVLDSAVGIVHELQIKMAMIDTMRMLGRMVVATVKDGELMMKFHPEIEVERDAAGTGYNIDFKPGPLKDKP